MQHLKKLKILCVEDNEFIREVYKNLFSIIFEKVYIAEDGKKALELFKNNSFDVILTDDKMPKMSGIELIKEIKKLDNKIPIILVSGAEKDEIENQIKNLDIYAYIKKPINKNDILNILKSLN